METNREFALGAIDMDASWIFVSAGERQLSDAYDALSNIRPMRRVILPHTWKASTKRREIVGTIVGQLRHACSLIKVCWPERRPTILICADNHYSALLVARCLRIFRRDIRVYLLNFFLHELGRRLVVKVILKLLFSPKCALLVQSCDEVDYYNALNPRLAVEIAPYALPKGAIPDIPSSEIRLGNYVFAGGRSNRDYQTIIAAAERLPGVPFLIAASKRYAITSELPPNVQLKEDIPSDEFHRLLAGSRCVVVSLKENTGSSGQMVVLAAMYYGKLVLYSEMPAIGQYFRGEKTGIAFRSGDYRDLTEKIEACCRNDELCLEIGVAGKQHFELFHTRDRFLAIMQHHIMKWVSDTA